MTEERVSDEKLPTAFLEELRDEIAWETGERVVGKQTLYRIIAELLDRRAQDAGGWRPIDPRGRHVAEAAVPQFVIDAFETRYGGYFTMERDDHEWRNTWRYKHEHIQSMWEGWRDGFIALAASPTMEPTNAQ